MKEKLNETVCEARPDEIFELIDHVNDLVEVDDDTPQSLPETNFETFPDFQKTEAISLVVEPRKHQSLGCEEFIENCTEKFLHDPLEANFHFCIDEKENSKRRRSRSLNLSTRSDSPLSVLSGGSTPPEKRYDLSRDYEKNIAYELTENNSSKRFRCCSPVFENEPDHAACEQSHINWECSRKTHPSETINDEIVKESLDKKSRVRLSIDDDVEENLLQNDDLNFDAGAAKLNPQDVLNKQRHLATDVTQRLEKRWLKSHFDENSERKNAVVAKKRTTKCMYNASEGHIMSPMTKRGLQITHKHDDTEEYAFGIIHFNDVYEIAERDEEPVAGAARFASLVKKKIAEAQKKYGERPLVIFSGDCLNPSTLSCATEGWHMVEILNDLGVDIAVFGNHEFDFGVEHAVKCVNKMDSKWLLANVEDKLTGKNLAEGIPSYMITRKNGFKIGVIGLVEEEWLDTLATVERSSLIFKDYVDVAESLAKKLKEEGAKFVIAVTHMRWPNDTRLAQMVPEVDLILGGHDHGYCVKEIDGCLVIKSGSDFRTFSTVDLHLWHDGCIDVKLKRYDITTNTASPDKSVQNIVNRYMSNLEKSLQACIGTIETNLNGKFDEIRQKETTMGNFVADIMATVARSDLVLINSGTFRSDNVHLEGEFRLHDLMTILPINDTLVTIEVTGQQLLEALENGVSKYPSLEGRFPQVSGACFGFNPNAEPGHRVALETIRVKGKPLELDRTYVMATKAYVARGRDGYTCLEKCRLLNDPDAGPLLSTVVRNHIQNVSLLKDFEEANNCTVKVSADGKKLTASRSDVDVTQAFNVTNKETPVSTIKKFMEGAMKDRDIFAETTPESNETQQNFHMPNFISVAQDFLDDESLSPADQDLAGKRRHTLNADEKNLNLLKERAKNPTDLKWQICPLIESRIFHYPEIES